MFRTNFRCPLFLAVSIWLLCAIAVAPAFAQDVGKAPLPDWVTDLAIPEPNPDRLPQVTSGTYYLLHSIQHRMKGTKHVRYVRSVTKVVNREGLEAAATISESFRPEFDTLTFHRIRVHRDDGYVDLLDQTKFRVFQQESNLEQGILDGELTAFTNLEAVRIGDVVEYAFSVAFEPILMPDHFFARFTTEFYMPVGLLERRAVVPDTLDVRVSRSKETLKVDQTDLPGETEYLFTSVDADPLDYEASVPSWHRVQGEIEFSSIPDWAQIAEDSLGHYPRDAELTPEFRAKLDVIANSGDSIEKQISKVLALVQTEIRYVGIEIGRGAFIPRAPDLVLMRGYGDCKDKSYLMVMALQYLGIEAVPALAHLGEGRGVGDLLPSPYAFNHVIVRATGTDRTFWLDPTGTQQYSPDPAQSQPEYGFVLPIEPDAEGLAEIVPTNLTEPAARLTETITLSEQTDGPPVSLRAIGTYRGDAAAHQRRRFANYGRQEMAERYEKYYRDLYGDLEASDLEVDDDREADILRIVETYSVGKTEDQDKLLSAFVLRGDAVRGILTDTDDTERTSPLWLRAPAFAEHVVNVRNLPGKFIPPDPLRIETRYLRFSRQAASGGTALSITWRLKTLAPSVRPEEFAEYREIVRQINEETLIEYDFARPGAIAEIADDDSFEKAAVIAAGIGALVLLYFIWQSGGADSAYRADGWYFPVSHTKLFVMMIATFGFYGVFWFYKFWRWIKTQEKRKLWAGVRALFYTFLPMHAFDEANGKLDEDRRLPRAWGPLALIAGIGSVILNAVGGSDSIPPLWYLITLVGTVILSWACIVPVAIAVNRQNQRTPESRAVLERNSRFTWLNIVGIVLCALFLAVIFDGLIEGL